MTSPSHICPRCHEMKDAEIQCLRASERAWEAKWLQEEMEHRKTQMSLEAAQKRVGELRADASRILGAAYELVAAVARRTPDGRAEVTVTLDAAGWAALEAERRRYLRPHASYVYAPHPDGAGAVRLVRDGAERQLIGRLAAALVGAGVVRGRDGASCWCCSDDPSAACWDEPDGGSILCRDFRALLAEVRGCRGAAQAQRPS